MEPCTPFYCIISVIILQDFLHFMLFLQVFILSHYHIKAPIKSSRYSVAITFKAIYVLYFPLRKWLERTVIGPLAYVGPCRAFIQRTLNTLAWCVYDYYAFHSLFLSLSARLFHNSVASFKLFATSQDILNW